MYTPPKHFALGSKVSLGEPVADWLILLRSKKRLDRENGLNKLKLLLQDVQDDVIGSIEAKLSEFVLSLTSLCTWEERHGDLLELAVYGYIVHLSMSCPTYPKLGQGGVLHQSIEKVLTLGATPRFKKKTYYR
jgi:hypothetical protein